MATNYFVTIEQLTWSYNIHIWEDETHFKAWMKIHPTKRMFPQRHGGTGRKHAEHNHVYEGDQAVNTLRLDMELGLA